MASASTPDPGMSPPVRKVQVLNTARILTPTGAPDDAGAAERIDLIRTTAETTFGFEQLRPGQLEAMQSLLAGRDTLVVLPTGGGKSAVYQIPALLLDGPTVVVSPLIALQRDQVAALLSRAGSGGAVSANSTKSRAEQDAAFEALRAGAVEFFFLAPEQLAKPEVV